MRTTLNLFLTPAYPGYGPPTTLSMELAPQNKKGGEERSFPLTALEIVPTHTRGSLKQR